MMYPGSLVASTALPERRMRCAGRRLAKDRALEFVCYRWPSECLATRRHSTRSRGTQAASSPTSPRLGPRPLATRSRGRYRARGRDSALGPPRSSSSPSRLRASARLDRPRPLWPRRQPRRTPRQDDRSSVDHARSTFLVVEASSGIPRERAQKSRAPARISTSGVRMSRDVAGASRPEAPLAEAAQLIVQSSYGTTPQSTRSGGNRRDTHQRPTCRAKAAQSRRAPSSASPEQAAAELTRLEEGKRPRRQRAMSPRRYTIGLRARALAAPLT